MNFSHFHLIVPGFLSPELLRGDGSSQQSLESAAKFRLAALCSAHGVHNELLSSFRQFDILKGNSSGPTSRDKCSFKPK